MPNLMADYIDRGLYPMDLGDESHMPYRVEVSEGHADIIWREELRFHRELADADHDRRPDLPAYKPWSHYLADEYFLTAENEAILVKELQKLTGIEDIETVEDGDPDEDGYVAFSIRTNYLPGETVAEWDERIGWKVIAALINSTDPGTFNYPYLFSAMLYKDAA